MIISIVFMMLSIGIYLIDLFVWKIYWVMFLSGFSFFINAIIVSEIWDSIKHRIKSLENNLDIKNK